MQISSPEEGEQGDSLYNSWHRRDNWTNDRNAPRYTCATNITIKTTGSKNYYLKVAFCVELKISPSSKFVHLRISKLGSGSDFEAYFIRLGIAAGRARYTKNKVSNVLI